MCVLSSLVELKNISIKDYVCTQHTLIKLQDILTVEVFKSKHIHLRILAQFPLYSCKMLMMLSKYKSLSPSQKNGSSYISLIFSVTSQDCYLLITPELQSKDTKVGIHSTIHWDY